MFRKLFVFTVVVMLSGCATIHSGPSVCDIESTMNESFLCQAAENSGIPLEEYGYILIDAELAAVITDQVTVEEIHGFCADMRRLLEGMRGRLTYTGLIRRVIRDTKDRAIFNLVSRRLIIFYSDLPISDIDIGFLLWQIDKLDAAV